MKTIKIRGSEYQVTSKPCQEDGTVYFLEGKRGYRWYTLRNQNYTYMLFLLSENGSNHTMRGVWLTDQNGTLEVAND
jgi:hypothetical protein